MLALTLALAAPAYVSASFPVPAQQDVVSVRMYQGQLLPTGDIVRRIERVAPNVGASGYACWITVDPGDRTEIWADFVDDGTTVPQRLYAVPFAPFDDANIWWIQAFRGDVIWEMRQTGVGIGERGVYRNGQPLVLSQSPSPIPGFDWGISLYARPTTAGTNLYSGSIYAPPQGAARSVIVEEGSTTTRLSVGDAIQGTSSTISEILGWSSSPDGSHVIAEVRASNGEYVVLLDGVRVELEGEVIRRPGVPSSSVLDALGNQAYRLSGIRALSVNDDGEWALGLAFTIFNNPPTVYWAARNGRLVQSSSDALQNVTMTKDSVALFGSGDRVSTGTGDVLRASAGVDFDGDGIAEPSWNVPYIGYHSDVNGSGNIYSVAGLRLGSGGFVSAIVSLPRRLPFRAICAGNPNAAGLSGSLYAVGADQPTANELALVAHGLPLNAAGYLLTSLTPSAPVQPTGSVGSLCLGGSIGRYVGSIFSSGSFGTGVTELDLTSMPQPTGSVQASAGQTWYFQAWYRDNVSGVPTSNFTDAVAVRMR